MTRTRTVRGIFGPAGSGKTHLAAKLYGQERRAVVYNFMRDEQFTQKSTFVTGEVRNIAHLMLTEDPPTRIDFQPQDVGQDKPESFDLLCREIEIIGQVLRKHDLRSAFYVDETHMLTSAGWSPEDFKRLIFTGRHLEIDMTFMAMRFAYIDKRLTHQTQVFNLFQTFEPSDLDAIAERFAGGTMYGGERIEGDAIAERVRNLRRADLRSDPVKPGQYLEIDTRTDTATVKE